MLISEGTKFVAKLLKFNFETIRPHLEGLKEKKTTAKSKDKKGSLSEIKDEIVFELSSEILDVVEGDQKKLKEIQEIVLKRLSNY